MIQQTLNKWATPSRTEMRITFTKSTHENTEKWNDLTTKPSKGSLLGNDRKHFCSGLVCSIGLFPNTSFTKHVGCERDRTARKSANSQKPKRARIALTTDLCRRNYSFLAGRRSLSENSPLITWPDQKHTTKTRANSKKTNLTTE